MRKHTKRIPVYILATAVMCFLVIWGASLLKCEILTHKYSDQFELAYQDNTMITDVQYFKVLKCDGKVAEVYYVSDNSGDIIRFEKQNGDWVETGWKTVWSKSGSASEECGHIGGRSLSRELNVHPLFSVLK